MDSTVDEVEGFQDPFGLSDMIKDVAEGILDKFISASEELKKIEDNIEE